MKTNKYRFWNCRLVELSATYVTVALFVLPLAAHGYQPEIVYEFGGTNGFQPNGLIQASDGNFYGTTSAGGDAYGNGTVFRLMPNGAMAVGNLDLLQGISEAHGTLKQTKQAGRIDKTL